MRPYRKVVGLVYEMSNNPYFAPDIKHFDDRLSEFVPPSEINALVQAFSELGWKTEIIDGPTDLLRRVDMIKEACHLIFNKSIGTKGLERKIYVPAICRLYDIPMVGSTSYGLTLARHKFHTNRLLHSVGLPVPYAVLLEQGKRIELGKLQFPVIVKPNTESDSLGIQDDSICCDEKSATKRISELWQQFDQPVIVEEFIDGEELKTPVIGNSKDLHAIGCVGVLKNGKTMKGTLQTRSDVIDNQFEYYRLQDQDKLKHVLQLAVWAHEVLNLADYSRCDFRLTDSGEVFILEVATHPYLGKGSSFVQAGLQTYHDYTRIIEAILQSAQSRFQQVATGI